MVPEVWDALRARIAQDRRSAGNPELAAGHYMDVVFRNAPMDADALIDLYQKLSDQRMGYLGSGKKSTFRLGPVARANASEMKALLDEADYARKGLYVVSALVVQLLRKLDEEGPLLRPELPPLLWSPRLVVGWARPYPTTETDSSIQRRLRDTPKV